MIFGRNTVVISNSKKKKKKKKKKKCVKLYIRLGIYPIISMCNAKRCCCCYNLLVGGLVSVIRLTQNLIL